MNPVLMDVLPFVRQGFCCSQLLMLLMLQARGEENPALVRSLQGLCHGIGHSEGDCGNKSRQLVRHYAEDLGYEYLSAENKEDYLRQLDRFLAPGLTDRPMLFEVFTDSRDESDAIRIMNNLNVSTKGVLKEAMKSVVGEKGKEMIKKVMGR